jgi:uncharacterized protein (DUF433 family)
MENFINYITIDPNVRFGKPCIKGTRITVQDILNWLASGMSSEDIIQDFPKLKEEHIKAVLFFAANSETRTRLISA